MRDGGEGYNYIDLVNDIDDINNVSDAIDINVSVSRRVISLSVSLFGVGSLTSTASAVWW